jgi:peptidoglycan/xylan/chitin deacetylase (PgdA/CDA1 family)
VLCYHNFDAVKITPYNVSSAHLREQMRYLKVQHLPVIPMAQLVAHLRSGAPIPDHAVVITIDDGYKTARTIAWPIFKQFGFPFTVFIYPQFLGHPSALSWEDVKAMSDGGVDVQSHSLTHPLLTHPGKAMARDEYVAWIDHELVESRKELQEHTGKPVNVLAYPFGGYDERIADRTARAGYLAALTCDDGNVTRKTDPMRINRRLVYRSVRLKEFSEYFPDRTLQMAELSPRDGERVKGPLAEIQARIVNADQIVPGSVKILVDKVGRHRQPVTLDPKSGRFRFPLPAEPKRGYYFVSLFAQDKADPSLRREASWLFILSKNASINRPNRILDQK